MGPPERRRASVRRCGSPARRYFHLRWRLQSLAHRRRRAGALPADQNRGVLDLAPRGSNGMARRRDEYVWSMVAKDHARRLRCRRGTCIASRHCRRTLPAEAQKNSSLVCLDSSLGRLRRPNRRSLVRPAPHLPVASDTDRFRPSSEGRPMVCEPVHPSRKLS